MRVIFIKTQPLDEAGDIVLCHVCEAAIAAVTYKKINNDWQIVSKQQKIGDVGTWGAPPEIKQVNTLQLTLDKFVFLIDDGDSAMGESIIREHIYVFFKK